MDSKKLWKLISTVEELNSAFFTCSIEEGYIKFNNLKLRGLLGNKTIEKLTRELNEAIRPVIQSYMETMERKIKNEVNRKNT